MRAINVWAQDGHLVCQAQEDGRFYGREEADYELAQLQEKVNNAARVLKIVRDFVEEVAAQRETPSGQNEVRPLTGLAVRATAIKEFLYPETDPNRQH